MFVLIRHGIGDVIDDVIGDVIDDVIGDGSYINWLP